MVVSVRLFAGLRERAGTDRLEVELPDGARVADVLAAMAATPVGELRPRECVVAVNREYAAADAPVSAGDEIALVPPVSGGAAIHVRVTGRAARRRGTRARRARSSRRRRRASSRASRARCPSSTTRPTPRWRVSKLEAIAAEEVERHGLCAVGDRAPHRHRRAVRAVGDRRRLGAAPRRGVRRRARADRPRQGRGADLEGRGQRGRPPARRRHAPAYVARRTSGSRLGVKIAATSTASSGTTTASDHQVDPRDDEVGRAGRGPRRVRDERAEGEPSAQPRPATSSAWAAASARRRRGGGADRGQRRKIGAALGGRQRDRDRDADQRDERGDAGDDQQRDLARPSVGRIVDMAAAPNRSAATIAAATWSGVAPRRRRRGRESRLVVQPCSRRPTVGIERGRQRRCRRRLAPREPAPAGARPLGAVVRRSTADAPVGRSSARSNTSDLPAASARVRRPS